MKTALYLAAACGFFGVALGASPVLAVLGAVNFVLALCWNEDEDEETAA